MVQHPFDQLNLSNGASFLFTPCPGTKEASLNEALKTLKDAGANAVVSTLSDAEISALEVGGLGNGVARLDMPWFQLPIEDDCAPDDEFFGKFAQVKSHLLNLIEQQATLVIHCRGGSGRTGLMAAILLLERGEKWQDIQPLIQSIRPKSLTLEPHLTFLQQHYSI